MKREFLKALELSDDVIDKIMAENGKDIEAEKSKSREYKSELDLLRTEKKGLEDKISGLEAAGADSEKLKGELETLKQKIEDGKKAAEAKRADEELTNAIVAAFGDKKFTSDYVKNGIIADMKSEIEKPENKGKGYSELFEALTKDKDGIFENPNKIINMGEFNDVDADITEEQMRAVMGLPPLK